MTDKNADSSVNKAAGPLAAVWGILKSVGVKGLAGLLAALLLNFMLMPIIKYDKNAKKFTVEYPARAVTLHIRPQMGVRYNDTVIILTHLLGYYAHETIYFSDNEAFLEEANQKHAERLMSYVRAAVLDELREDGYSEAEINEINGRLSVYMSMICGIRFEPRFGNGDFDRDRYCIIENDGIMIDCACDNDKVLERLRDYELVLDGDTDAIRTSAEVDALVCVIVKEVKNLYDS